MPRDGSGVYSKPAGTTASPNTTIESAKYNSVVDDQVVDANAARPITAGGTGRATARLLDGTWRFENTADPTKLLAFDLSGLTTATTRTLTAPNASGTIALTSDLGTGSSPANLGLVATVASNALTIAIKGYDGNDPSATNPVYIPFRSATASSGDVDVLAITSATSLVVSSGSTLGTTSAVAATLVVVGFNDGGTFRLGVINPSVLPIKDGIASSTAEGGAGAADSAGVYYTGTAVSSKALTVLGFITVTEATAGTWATAPTTVQVGAAAATALQTGGSGITLGTPVATTSGTAHNWTGIPSWAKRVTVSFAGVSLSGAADYLIRIGSGSVDTTGYLSGWGIAVASSTSAGGTSTAGFIVGGASNPNVMHGTFVLALVDATTNTWTISGGIALSNTPGAGGMAGTKSLSGALDRIQLTTTNGTDTFDFGKANIAYEP